MIYKKYNNVYVHECFSINSNTEQRINVLFFTVEKSVIILKKIFNHTTGLKLFTVHKLS